jgi:hypothetical protein
MISGDAVPIGEGDRTSVGSAWRLVDGVVDIWLGGSGGGTFAVPAGSEMPIDDRNETSLSYSINVRKLDKSSIKKVAYYSGSYQRREIHRGLHRWRVYRRRRRGGLCQRG